MRDTSSNIYNPQTSSQQFGDVKNCGNYDKTVNDISDDKTGKYFDTTMKNQTNYEFKSNLTQFKTDKKFNETIPNYISNVFENSNETEIVHTV